MTFQNTFDVRPGVAINVWIAARRHSALMLEISGDHAVIEIPDDIDLAETRVVAILLREFFSVTMRVEHRQGQELTLSYLNPPHPSVLAMAIGRVLDQGVSDSIIERTLVEHHREVA
ncbi:MAG: hypothetical protein AAGK01_07940 [Pseudomonadota bacterium]